MKAIIKATGKTIEVSPVKETVYMSEDKEMYFGQNLEVDFPKIDIEGITYIASPAPEDCSCTGCDLRLKWEECEDRCFEFSKELGCDVVLIKKD